MDIRFAAAPLGANRRLGGYMPFAALVTNGSSAQKEVISRARNLTDTFLPLARNAQSPDLPIGQTKPTSPCSRPGIHTLFPGSYRQGPAKALYGRAF